MNPPVGHVTSTAICDALDRYLTAHPGAKPTRVILGDYAYGMIHAEAHEAGIEAKKYPRYEDERLEFRGMKVCCHTTNAIEFA